MIKKDGFIYFFSHELGQNIALSKKSGSVYCEDKTIYSPSELQLLKNHGGLSFKVHLIKKVFNGTIEEIKLKSGETKCIADKSKNTSKQEKSLESVSTQKQTEQCAKKFSVSPESVIF